MRSAQRAALLGMARMVDFANWTDIPLTMDVDMSEVMTLETRLVVVRMVAGESINWYAVNGCGREHQLVCREWFQ